MCAAGAAVLLPDADALVAFGGLDADRVWRGEVWRVFSATFVHFGLWHIAMNLWVLSQVGKTLERFVGTSRFVLIYLAAGLFGFALSLLLRPGLAVGASGCIFGATGGLLALAQLVRNGPLGRFLLRALVPFVGATLALGFLLPFIDNSAHVGGLVMGYLLTYGLVGGDRSFLVDDAAASPPAPPGERRRAVAALVVAAVAFTVVVPLALRPAHSPLWLARQGLAALAQGDVEAARAFEARAERLAPKDPAVLVLAGRIRLAQDRAAEGRALIEAALAATGKAPGAALAEVLVSLSSVADPLDFRDPKTAAAVCEGAIALTGDGKDAVLRNNCAWLYLKATDEAVHDPPRALALARRAVAEPGGDDADIVGTLAEAYAQTGDPREAENILARMLAEGRGDDATRAERDRFRLAADAQAVPASSR